VIGVNAQIETGDSGTSGNVGVGFAIPSNTVKTVIAQLIREGHVDRAFIGISATPITRDLARVFRLPVSKGLLVQSVQPGSGAAAAGLKAGTTNVVLAGESYNLGGDIIVQADGAPIASLDRLRDVVATKKPGDKVRLVIYRAGKRTTVQVKLGRQPTVRSG
jgi:S1-C subfamily serine protease